jgi:condensin complex subunit 3
MPTRSGARLGRPARAKKTEAPVEITETPASALRNQVCAIFRDAQRTTATHRKLAVNLRKIQESCCYEPVSTKNPSEDQFDEKAFNHEFVRCVLRIMPVKKAESVGEKLIRFIGLFLRHASDKDNELLDEADVDTSLMPETPSTRLSTEVLRTAQSLMQAKDKYVRFRSTQLVSHIINSLEAIDDDLFQNLRNNLLKRIRDRKPRVLV